MKKLLFSAAIAALSFAGVSAQTVYNWNLRAGLGATSHLGTALDSTQTHPVSYQLQLERRINRGLSAYLSAEGGAIGSIFPAASSEFAKSFKTNFTTFSAGAILMPNNDRILRYEAAVVPYLGIGIGATNFLAKGYVAGKPTAVATDTSKWAFNAAATAGVNFRLTPNWSVYTALTAHLPLDKTFTRTLTSSLTYPVVLNGIFGVAYTFGRSSRENYSPNVFSYIETEAVLPSRAFTIDPFTPEGSPKVDTTKLLNDEMTALKAKVSAMEGEMSSLRTKAEGGSADAAELKRLQDEVTRLNGDLEKAKNQIADLTIQAAQPAVVADHTPRNVGAHDTWPGVNKQNYPNYFAYPPASLDGIFSQLKPITLDMSGESTVRGENKNQLVNLPDLLARYPNLGVVISANATGAGGANADLTLSKKRAVSAEQFFLRNGATSRQVISNYYGSEDPSAGNTVKIEFIKLK